MGRRSRPQPRRMRFKLHAIRKHLNLTLKEMVERLEYHESPLYPHYILEYEQGRRDPPVLVLLRYARVARVTMEMLVDDEMELPEKLRIHAKRAENEYAVENLKEGVKEFFEGASGFDESSPEE